MIVPITSKKRKKNQEKLRKIFETCLGLLLGVFLGIIIGIKGVIIFLLILILYFLNKHKK